VSNRFGQLARNRIIRPTRLRQYMMSFFGVTFLAILVALGFSVVFFTYQTEEQGWRASPRSRSRR